MRPKELFNPPTDDTLNNLTPENHVFFDEIINSLSEEQAKQVIMTMLRDPCNNIDLDNFSHYFC